jgi:hypothetical protein
MALWDALEDLDQIIVDPLALGFVANYKPVHSILA